MITVLLLLLKSIVTNLVIYLFIKKSKDREMLDITKDVILFKEDEIHKQIPTIKFLRRNIIGKFFTSLGMFILMYPLLIAFVTVKALVMIPVGLFRLFSFV